MPSCQVQNFSVNFLQDKENITFVFDNFINPFIITLSIIFQESSVKGGKDAGRGYPIP